MLMGTYILLEWGRDILLETCQDMPRDMRSLISSCKEKHQKGLPIPISVVEWSLNKKSTESTASIAPADSLQKADAMIREKDAQILRLSDRIKVLEFQLHDRSPEDTVAEFELLTRAKNSALLSALMVKMETRFKEQDAEMERCWKNHQETFTKELAASEQRKKDKLAVLESILDGMVIIFEEQDTQMKHHSNLIRELSESKTKEQEEASANTEELVRTCSKDVGALLPSAPMMIQQAIVPVPDIVDGGVQEEGYILVSEQLSSQDEEDTSNKSASSNSYETILIVEEESEASAAEQPILSKNNSIRPRPRVFSLTDDNVIDAALKKMQAMGYNDKGGFLNLLNSWKRREAI